MVSGSRICQRYRLHKSGVNPALQFESLPLLVALRRLGHSAAEPLLADRFPWALNLR